MANIAFPWTAFSFFKQIFLFFFQRALLVFLLLLFLYWSLHSFALITLIFLNSFVIEHCIFSLYKNYVKVTSTSESNCSPDGPMSGVLCRERPNPAQMVVIFPDNGLHGGKVGGSSVS